jgi:antitoxin VapB
MALNIKNEDVERLLNEVVGLTGESKTEAVRKALEERRQRLALRAGGRPEEVRLYTFLNEELWPQIPPGLKGTRLSKQEEAEILGYDDEVGV